MYKITQPAMVCNANNLEKGFIPYAMWNTRTVTQDVPARWLAQNIADVAKTAQGGYLRALVLNAHGYPGNLGLGTGIDTTSVKDFALLKGLVKEIYIVGCAIAGARQSKVRHGEWLDGLPLCTTLAQSAGAHVYAPKTGQRQSKEDRRSGIPFGYIDDFEGETVVCFPDGSSQPWNGKTSLVFKD